MARYSTLSATQIDYLAGLHDLQIDNWQPMKGGAANSSFLLQADGDKYVLTVYEDKTIAQVVAMGQTLQVLISHRFPTVVVVPTTLGEVGIEFKGKPVLLKEYIHGQVELDMDQDMFLQIGHSLAQLHKIPAPEYLDKVHPYGPDNMQKHIGSGIDDEYDSWLYERLLYLEEHWPANLPRALVHGDLFYDNVLFMNGKLKAIIDFEEVCNYFRVFDVGMALLGLCVKGGTLDLGWTRDFILGYLEVGRLEEVERNALQLMIMSAAVGTSYWRFWKYNIHDPTPERAEKHWEIVDIADQVHSIKGTTFMKEVFGG